MAYKPVTVVEVRAWGKTVGACTLDPRSGFYAFEYDGTWATHGRDLAPLVMPIADGPGPYVFPALPETTFKRLPAMLADAIPDDFGNALIDAYMAREGVAADQITPLDRLGYMSSRGFGALEFRPARGPRKAASTALDMAGLVEAARGAVRGELDTDNHAKAALTQLLQVGTSAGGARAKAAIAWNPQTLEVRAGQFEVSDGFEHWLLKLDGVGKDLELGTGGDYGRIEYAYHLMALAAGVEMMPCRLLEEHGRAHFMTRRFDRVGNAKLHLQSLCGLAHVDFRLKGVNAYEQLFTTIDRLGLGEDARLQAWFRMCTNVLSANCDDHSKNFAFLLSEQGPWRMSPAFDITHAFNPTGEWTYQHLMSVNGRFSDIARADLYAVGERFEIPALSTNLDRVAAAVADWPKYGKEAGLAAPAIKRIEKDFRRAL